MPIYEYTCLKCKRRSSIFFRSYSAVDDPACSHCGSREMRRLVSRFAVAKSEEARLDDMSDPSQLAGVDENDPRSIARWARRMGQEMGEEMGPEFDEMVDRMEAGEMPDEMDGGGGDDGDDDLD